MGRHAEHRGEMQTKLQSEKLKGKHCLRDIGLDERVILKWLEIWCEGLDWLGQGALVGSSEHGNESWLKISKGVHRLTYRQHN